MPGRNFLFVPGPTNVPDRVLRAMHRAMEDHRSSDFPELTLPLFRDLKKVFKTADGQAFLFPASGTGAWEAALANTLSPGDKVLAPRFGQFSHLWIDLAQRIGLDVQILETEWGEGAPLDRIEDVLSKDKGHAIKGVMVVHNETATGVTSDVAGVRRAMKAAGHPALLYVDGVSSIASLDFRMDEWGVDVALTGPQKGLMLPPGMAIVAASQKAVDASEKAKCPRSYWDWTPVIERNRRGEYPYTPATSLLFGLRESLAMLSEEGLTQAFKRHARLGEACRRAVRGLGLEILCRNPAEYSNTLTAVVMPRGKDSDAYIAHANQALAMSLGAGLGDMKGQVFRIGHLGSLNELELLGGLAGVEMTLRSFGVDVRLGAGLAAAQQYLLETA
jgi:alanine-glyoxylate transaminase/serine-glyoxylate transaminase/serine-pyruvate transaminase